MNRRQEQPSENSWSRIEVRKPKKMSNNNLDASGSAEPSEGSLPSTPSSPTVPTVAHKSPTRNNVSTAHKLPPTFLSNSQVSGQACLRLAFQSVHNMECLKYQPL
ncbi:Hypothetical predicted protein, partial [Paramuricea clavata]